MVSKQKDHFQLGFYSTFEEQLSHQHPLYILAHTIEWNVFETAFSKLYSEEGRPGKPIRLMVSLLILKHIRNICDECLSPLIDWTNLINQMYPSDQQHIAS